MTHQIALWALGTAGNLAFGYACLPTAWKTWRAGKSIGTPIGLAWNILIACLLFYGYLIGTYGFDPFICACSCAEVAAYSVVIWYHYFPVPWWADPRVNVSLKQKIFFRRWRYR